MNEAPVALAAIAVLATVCGGVVWALKFLLKDINKTLKEKSKSENALATAIANLNTTILQNNQRDQEYHNAVMNEFKMLSEKADRNYQATLALKVNEAHIEAREVKVLKKES